MNFYTRKRRMPTIIIVALIDIFVILLIFVVMTTTFKRPQPSIVLRLPEAGAATGVTRLEKEPPLTITVAEDGAVFFNETAVAVEGLVAALKPFVEGGIALKADTNAPFGRVVRVMDALKEAGVKGNLPAFTEIREIPKE